VIPITKHAFEVTPEYQEMTELSFLLPGWQAAEMERMASAQGKTLGQLLRLLIQDYLAGKAKAGKRGDIHP
jgi:hypothetical protein